MVKKIPRKHQLDCVDAIRNAWGEKEAPYADCCPASGKSLVLAILSERVLNKGGRVLQLVPKIEHVNQNFAEMIGWTDHSSDIGICNSKKRLFQTHKKCVIATASSFLNRRATSGRFDVLLIDECHNVSNDPMSGYRKIVRSLMRQNPDLYIAGVSGSPYRMGQGYLHNHCLKGKALFSKLVYSTSISEMIEKGYLSAMKSISDDIQIDMSSVKMKGQDYDTSAMAVKFDAICADAVLDIQVKMDHYNLNTGILFVSNVANANLVADLWRNQKEIRVLHGSIKDSERIEIINWLEKGQGRRVVVNPNILCEGYDFPALDLVGLLRATASLRLYVQMVCRAIRAFDNKLCGYVIDFGGNIERHGAIDNINPPSAKKKKQPAPKKLCTAILEDINRECFFENILSAKKCKSCGAEFMHSKDGKYSMRSKSQVLQLKREQTEETHFISRIVYQHVHSNKTGIPMIKMIYITGEDRDIHKQYLCLDHKGRAYDEAYKFLLSFIKNRSDLYKLGTVGVCVKVILPLLQNNPEFFKKIKSITTYQDGKYRALKEVNYENT